MSVVPRYKKMGNLVYGLPFKDGSMGIKKVKDKIRIFPLEPVIRVHKLTAKEKLEVVK